MSTITLKSEWRFPVENSFVRDTSVSVEARLLYIIIKGYAGPDCAMPFPSLHTLSRHMDRHRESVQKYLKELEESGYIVRQHLKVKGKYASTRYELRDRSGKKPLRKLPTTEKAATKSYQYKESPDEAKDKSKETKETSPVGDVVDFEENESESTWKPDSRTKAQKLKTLKQPPDYPSERQFDAFLQSEMLDNLTTYRPDIYSDLCRNKWHTWNAALEKWARIVDWRKYAAGLDGSIAKQFA